MKSITLVGIVILAGLSACQPAKEVKYVGSIERIDPSLDQIISPGAMPEVIAEGFTWSEGPVWIGPDSMLLFSDVPKNTVFKWTEAKGLVPYLTPSGYTGSVPRGGEPGSNGLFYRNGILYLCQHGDRRLASMDSPIRNPKPVFKTVASNYRGKNFDSPNDVTMDSKGNFYLTDPPYGLLNHEKDSSKAAPYQGVYKIFPDGRVSLLVDSLTKPNGIALSPDEKFLFVANSDPQKARWYRYELGDSTVLSGSVFQDATSMTAAEKGLPDGMKIDKAGNLFASGPGGILIFSPDAKLLGKIKLPNATANCTFTDDGSTLYMTSHMQLLRLKLH
jgi:gluconolactonase